jgi:hypothetical protein
MLFHLFCCGCFTVLSTNIYSLLTNQFKFVYKEEKFVDKCVRLTLTNLTVTNLSDFAVKIDPLFFFCC